jgi:putative oxidoreductase
MVGSVLLFLGFLVRPVAVGFIVNLTMGIILVHRHSGWFVVGGGQNGMEYSVLLVAGMVAMVIAGPPRGRLNALVAAHFESAR